VCLQPRSLAPSRRYVTNRHSRRDLRTTCSLANRLLRGGLVALPVVVGPIVGEPVLLPVLLPEVVLGRSVRTCLVTLPQHFPDEAGPGGVVVVEV
jgi:hypothetical protein